MTMVLLVGVEDLNPRQNSDCDLSLFVCTFVILGLTVFSI
jgi:hypothetical protein